jgi:hypothetical protein
MKHNGASVKILNNLLSEIFKGATKGDIIEHLIFFKKISLCPCFCEGPGKIHFVKMSPTTFSHTVFPYNVLGEREGAQKFV